MYNPCDAVTLPGGEKPEIVVFTNDQQRALVQASYRHRYGVFIRLDLCTGLRMGELLALKWEDIDFSTAQLHRTPRPAPLWRKFWRLRRVCPTCWRWKRKLLKMSRKFTSVWVEKRMICCDR